MKFNAKILIFINLIFLPSLSEVYGQVVFLNTTAIVSVKYDPPDLGEFRVGDQSTLEVLVTSVNDTVWGGDLRIDCEHRLGCPLDELAGPDTFSETESIQLDQSNNFTHLLNLSLTGTFVGLNRIRVTVGKRGFGYIVRTSKTELGSLLTDLFAKALLIAIIFGNFLAGTQIVPSKINLQNCCFIFAAVICQFLINPLVGFVLAKYVLANQLFVVRLSLFLVSCAPAGVGKSNFWTVIFGGDLALAGILTLVQRIGTIVFTPFWIHFFGRQFFVHRIKISTHSLAKCLAAMFVPFLLGMIFVCCGGRGFFQKFTQIIKTVSSVATLAFVLLAVAAHWPLAISALSSPFPLLPVLFLFPVLCHALALLLASVLRLPPGARLCLATESGVFSTGLAMLALLGSLGEPERDVAMLVPVGLALLAEKPMLALCMAQIGHRALCSKKGAKIVDQQNGQSSTAIPSTSTTQIHVLASSDLSARKLERIREIGEKKMERAI